MYHKILSTFDKLVRSYMSSIVKTNLAAFGCVVGARESTTGGAAVTAG